MAGEPDVPAVPAAPGEAQSGGRIGVDEWVASHDVRRERAPGPLGVVQRELERLPRPVFYAAFAVAAALAALLDRRDPLVDADLGVLRLVGAGGNARELGAAARHQTFCTAARPSSPLGRTSMTAIRSANTIASENVDEM